jgi:hypothetical protein
MVPRSLKDSLGAIRSIVNDAPEVVSEGKRVDSKIDDGLDNSGRITLEGKKNRG